MLRVVDWEVTEEPKDKKPWKGKVVCGAVQLRSTTIVVSPSPLSPNPTYSTKKSNVSGETEAASWRVQQQRYEFCVFWGGQYF